MPKLCQGRIVWTAVADPRGHNAYHRPVVILTRDHEIDAHDELYGVVASNTAANQQPRPSSYIEIPHHPQGRARTKLRKPTVAVCEWIVPVAKDAIADDDMAGIVPPGVLKTIVEKCIEIHGTNALDI